MPAYALLVFHNSHIKLTTLLQKKRTFVDDSFLLFSQWESFKAALHLSAKPMKIKPNPKPMGPGSAGHPGPHQFKTRSQRTEQFTLADYTAQTLAEQLTLMQQVYI